MGRINSQSKGKSGEREIVKLLNTRFNTDKFSRVVGSGARWGQISCPSKDYISDIVCPEGFRYSIECKIGYSDVRLPSLFTKSKKIEDFLGQSQRDAKLANKLPMVIWRQDRSPWLCFLKHSELSAKNCKTFEYHFRYGIWIIALFDKVLTLPDELFFEK